MVLIHSRIGTKKHLGSTIHRYWTAHQERWCQIRSKNGANLKICTARTGRKSKYTADGLRRECEVLGYEDASYTVTSRELVRQVPRERRAGLLAFLLGGAGLRWRPLSVSSEAPTEPAGETTPKTPKKTNLA